MSHSSDKDILGNLLSTHLPNRKDNLNQVIIKLVFVITLLTMIVSFVSVSFHFLQIKSETDIIKNNYELLGKDEPLTRQQINAFLNINTDFRGYIKIGDTTVNNPVFQSKNNTFYKNHNQIKEKSIFGSLYFDCDNKITFKNTDKNLVIYGNKTENGQLFSALENYKNIEFYKENPTINLSTFYFNNTYAIYSVFLINSKAEDDGGYIYNYTQKEFLDALEFDNWVFEAKQRSIINTDVTAEFKDTILTLVTDSEEFEGAKLVVMAQKVQEDETLNTSNATISKSPRYPQVWYKNKGIDFPFENN